MRENGQAQSESAKSLVRNLKLGGNLVTQRFAHEVIVTANNDPMIFAPLPGHSIAVNNSLAAFGIFLNREDEILNDCDIPMKAYIDGTQFANGDVGRLGPETDPFFQPGAIDRDGAFMPVTNHLRMNVFNELINTLTDEMIPVIFDGLPDRVLISIPVFRFI